MPKVCTECVAQEEDADLLHMIQITLDMARRRRKRMTAYLLAMAELEEKDGEPEERPRRPP